MCDYIFFFNSHRDTDRDRQTIPSILCSDEACQKCRRSKSGLSLFFELCSWNGWGKLWQLMGEKLQLVAQFWFSLNQRGENVFEKLKPFTGSFLLEFLVFRHFVNVPFCQHSILSIWLSSIYYFLTIFTIFAILSIWQFVNIPFCHIAFVLNCHFVNKPFST